MEITLLGAGLLGGAIGERLLRCGHRLTVWNRSPGRCEALVALGNSCGSCDADRLTFTRRRTLRATARAEAEEEASVRDRLHRGCGIRQDGRMAIADVDDEWAE